jgi:RluA family pseudouridine synthase
MEGQLQERVLFCDEKLLAINKPAGVSVVFDPRRPQESPLWRKLWALFGPVYVVHRLDRQTTGVWLLARSPEGQKHMALAFQNHQVEKVYHAVVEGSPPWTELLVDMPLLANADRKHRTLVNWDQGKPARTLLRVLRTLGEGLALVEAVPATGRRHQVRAHLAAVGFPLVGDSLYGGRLSGPRPLLHARSLAFRHPGTGSWQQVQAPYPQDMACLVGEEEPATG